MGAGLEEKGVAYRRCQLFEADGDRLRPPGSPRRLDSRQLNAQIALEKCDELVRDLPEGDVTDAVIDLHSAAGDGSRRL